MEETINELRDIISDQAQNNDMDSMLYHSILTRLDYLETEFLKLNLQNVRRSAFNEVYDKWVELTDDAEFTKWLNRVCG